uniref:Uncharacterized protein n=1 Tax=Megaselia scalaris TaxID=36166 RepID=T1GPS4_MEGSC
MVWGIKWNPYIEFSQIQSDKKKTLIQQPKSTTSTTNTFSDWWMNFLKEILVTNRLTKQTNK